MTLMISQERLNQVKACVNQLQEQVDLLQAGIDFNVESGLVPSDVPWFPEERRDILRQATILVFLSELNLACYPLNESSVLFIE